MTKEKKSSMIGWIFICCWLTYMTAYLCRVNFSSAMDAFGKEKGFSPDRLGNVGAVFFVVYACGQLINGYISDRVAANRYMLLALCGTMISNLGMAFVADYRWMFLFWGLNGCFQSMFWCTMIRVLAQKIPSSKRAAVSAGLSLTMPVAYFISWGLMGHLLDGASVKWYFLIPALICLPLIGAWLLLSRKISFQEEHEKAKKPSMLETIRFLGKEKLWWIAAVCLFHGLLKEGAAYWLPLLIAGMDEVQFVSPHLLSCILPVTGMMGVFFSKALLRDGRKNPYLSLMVLVGATGILCLGLILSHGGLITIGMIALVSGLCSGANTILVSFLPMQYTEKNMVASVVGFFDFTIYVGAAISTYVLGKVLSTAGFGPLPWIWLGACMLSILVLLPPWLEKRKEKQVTIAS